MLFKMIKWFEGTVLKLNIESFKKQQRTRSQDNSSSTWHLQRGSNKSNTFPNGKSKTTCLTEVHGRYLRLEIQRTDWRRRRRKWMRRKWKRVTNVIGMRKLFGEIPNISWGVKRVRYCHRIHRNSPVASSRFSRRNSSPPPLSPPPPPLSPLLLLLLSLSPPSSSYYTPQYSILLLKIVFLNSVLLCILEKKIWHFFDSPISLTSFPLIYWCLLWQIYSFEIQEIYVNAWNLYQYINITNIYPPLSI